MKQTILTILSISILLLTSCKKEEVIEEAPSNTSYLTSSLWQYVKTDTYYNDEYQNTYEDEDDVWKFNTDGTVVVDNHEGHFEGSWNFLSGETELFVNFGGGDVDTWEIKTLNASSFVYKIDGGVEGWHNIVTLDH